MSLSPLITIDDLRFSYGEAGFRLVVDRLDINAGERIACIGPSGTGKTTLVNLIAGILVPDAGRVTVAGEAVSALGDAERRRLRIRGIGMVFQEFELLEYLSALENVLLPYHVTPHLELTPEVRARAEELGRTCGLGHALSRRPRGLSQGERQRVAICRALVTEPRLIMCDEPTGNLDPRTADVTLDLLFAQVAARGTTLLMVTHDHRLLDRFDRVINVEELSGEAVA